MIENLKKNFFIVLNKIQLNCIPNDWIQVVHEIVQWKWAIALNYRDVSFFDCHIAFIVLSVNGRSSQFNWKFKSLIRFNLRVKILIDWEIVHIFVAVVLCKYQANFEEKNNLIIRSKTRNVENVFPNDLNWRLAFSLNKWVSWKEFEKLN